MALIETPPAAAPEVSPPAGEPRGFRPTSRRRARIAGGAALAAIAIGGNVLVYSSLDKTSDVLQVVNNVRAGEQIGSDDLRVVSVDVDSNVPAVAADQQPLVVGQYARTYIASGSLLVPQILQDAPLVTPGAAVVSIELAPTAVPHGLRERSQVMLIIDRGDGEPPLAIAGRVVARPADDTSSAGPVAISVEVAEADAPVVVNADQVGVLLLPSGVDPALDAGAARSGVAQPAPTPTSALAVAPPADQPSPAAPPATTGAAPTPTAAPTTAPPTTAAPTTAPTAGGADG